jgi:hypothetical protein
VRFPDGTPMMIDFLLTKLDPSCSAVLGHRWLHRYNPRIDWFNGRISFNSQISPTVSHDFAPGFFPEPSDDDSTSECDSPLPASRSRSAHTPAQRGKPPPPIPSKTVGPSTSGKPDFIVEPPPRDAKAFKAAVKKVDIRFIGAAAFDTARRQKKSFTSAIYVRDHRDSEDVRARSASAKPASESGENIPTEYHDYLDVFSTEKSNRLPEHRAYDLKIEMEPGSQLPSGPIYSLSEVEQTALREYIQENLAKGHIRPSSSPGGAPVLFVKKADGTLRLSQLAIKDIPVLTLEDLLGRTGPFLLSNTGRVSSYFSSVYTQ